MAQDKIPAETTTTSFMLVLFQPIVGNKTRVTIEQGCLRPYQPSFMLLRLDDFSKRAGKFKNDISLLVMTMTIATVMLQNVQESPHLQLKILAFV